MILASKKTSRKSSLKFSCAVHGLLNNSAPYLKANYAEPISVWARAKVADGARGLSIDTQSSQVCLT